MERTYPEIPWPYKEALNSFNILYSTTLEVDKHHSKKNNKSIGYTWRGKPGAPSRLSPFIRTNSDTRMAEELLLPKLQTGTRNPTHSFPLRVPVLGLFMLELPNFRTKKNEINLRAGDSTNLVQMYEDALQKSQILKDDALFTSTIIIRKQGPINKVTIWLLDAPGY